MDRIGNRTRCGAPYLSHHLGLTYYTYSSYSAYSACSTCSTYQVRLDQLGLRVQLCHFGEVDQRAVTRLESAITAERNK